MSKAGQPVVIAAGGTGGHLFPAEALAIALRARNVPVILATDGRVDEIGTPAQLATSGGIYAELLALQSSADEVAQRRLRDRFAVRA